MSEERAVYDDKTAIVISPTGVKVHADLVQRGLQSRVRAIMSIYGVNREEAETILDEIQNEYSEYGTPVQIPFPAECKK